MGTLHFANIYKRSVQEPEKNVSIMNAPDPSTPTKTFSFQFNFWTVSCRKIFSVFKYLYVLLFLFLFLFYKYIISFCYKTIVNLDN